MVLRCLASLSNVSFISGVTSEDDESVTLILVITFILMKTNDLAAPMIEKEEVERTCIVSLLILVRETGQKTLPRIIIQILVVLVRILNLGGLITQPPHLLSLSFVNRHIELMNSCSIFVNYWGWLLIHRDRKRKNHCSITLIVTHHYHLSALFKMQFFWITFGTVSGLSSCPHTKVMR